MDRSFGYDQAAFPPYDAAPRPPAVQGAVSRPDAADLPAVPGKQLSLGLQRHTHTHTFNGSLSGTTRVSRYQKGKTNLDFTEARDIDWQWHQLVCMQICTLLQTDKSRLVYLSGTSLLRLSWKRGR